VVGLQPMGLARNFGDRGVESQPMFFGRGWAGSTHLSDYIEGALNERKYV